MKACARIAMLLTSLVLVLMPSGAPAAAQGTPGSCTLAADTFCATVSEIPCYECRALEALYHSTGGPQWLQSENWLNSPTPSDWYGVTVSGGHVTALDLSANELQGPLPPEIGALGALQRLDLGGNRLHGPIPDELGELQQLEALDLGANALSGEVPASLTRLTALDPLQTDLRYNMLAASHPVVAAFLDAHAPGWAETQTVPPTNVRILGVTESTVTVGWDPIAYTGDDGFYEVSYALNKQPWVLGGRTVDKTATSLTVENLPSGQTFYFTVRAYTPAHGDQLNNLYSAYSPWPGAVPGPSFTATPTAQPTENLQHLEYEAEEAYGGTRLDDYRWTFMRILDRADASGCSYVSHWYRQSQGYITFTLDIPVTDTYYLWARVSAPNDRRNSFYIALDKLPEERYEFDHYDSALSWAWERVKLYTMDSTDPTWHYAAYYLTAGRHKLTFRGRELEANIDVIALTNSFLWQPGQAQLQPCTTITPSPTPTATATATRTPTATCGPSPTPTGTLTPSSTPTVTRTPSITPTPSVTHTPSATPSPTETATATPTGTPTATGTVTPTETPTLQAPATPTETATLTATPPPRYSWLPLLCR